MRVIDCDGWGGFWGDLGAFNQLVLSKREGRQLAAAVDLLHRIQDRLAEEAHKRGNFDSIEHAEDAVSEDFDELAVAAGYLSELVTTYNRPPTPAGGQYRIRFDLLPPKAEQ